MAESLADAYPEHRAFFESLDTPRCDEAIYYERLNVCTQMMALRDLSTAPDGHCHCYRDVLTYLGTVPGGHGYWYSDYLWYRMPHLPTWHPRMVNPMWDAALMNVPATCTYLHKAIRESLALTAASAAAPAAPVGTVGHNVTPPFLGVAEPANRLTSPVYE
jgi:hypothetical protein